MHNKDLGAVSQARLDWKEEKVVHLAEGLSSGYGPTLMLESGFYLSILCKPPSARYIEEYNHEVQKLTRLHGLPPWAPIKRLPTRDDVLVAMRSAFRFDHYKPTGFKEIRLLESLTKHFSQDVSLWSRIEEREVLLVEFSHGAQNRVEILDYREFGWMATYHFPKSTGT